MSDEVQSPAAHASFPVNQELQERLAKRIKKASEGDYNVSSWLAIEVGQHGFLVPLSHASEISPYAFVHPVPYTKPWFMGVTNLRGELMAIVDIGLFLNLPGQLRTEAALANAKFLTFNPVLEVNAALLIDKLLGLKSVSAFVSAEPRRPNDASFLGHIYTDTAGKRWQEINLQSLSQLPEFLAISK